MRSSSLSVGLGRLHHPPTNLPHPQLFNVMQHACIGQGIEVITCRTCVGARGLTHDELIEEGQIGTTVGNLAK